MDLSRHSPATAGTALDLLFIHHSVGGQLLADRGPADPAARNSIHRTHPNGGGLRARLEAEHYMVHEAAYSSVIGQRTDLFDWVPKFRDHMPRIRATRHQDERLSAGENRIVLFKSCYPNSAFREDEGEARSEVPALTLTNAKPAFAALREVLAGHPDILFVYFTAPPLRLRPPPRQWWKRLARRALGRARDDVTQITAAAHARTFNNWLKAPAGWLRDYPFPNIVVFDYFDVLTADGRSNFLEFPSNGGTDDHPSAAGQRSAAARFVPFLNRAVHRFGLPEHHPAVGASA